MKMVYWIIFLTIFYAYIGYPIALYLFINLFYRENKKKVIPEINPYNEWPNVSLLIAAYNEEKVIGAKIENCLIARLSQRFSAYMGSI